MFVICLSGMTISAEEKLSFDRFLDDLVSGLNVRDEYVKSLKKEVLEKEEAVEAAKKEWEKLESYDGVDFLEEEDGNSEYLRREYMDGLKQQVFLKNDDTEFWEKWDEGYKKRAIALEEIEHVYCNSPVEGLLDKLNDGILDVIRREDDSFCENGAGEACQLQALVGVSIDGRPGRGTIAALKKRQEELGLSINGVVNKNRVEELVKVVDKNEIVEANEKLRAAGEQNLEIEVSSDGTEDDVDAGAEENSFSMEFETEMKGGQ